MLLFLRGVAGSLIQTKYSNTFGRHQHTITPVFVATLLQLYTVDVAVGDGGGAEPKPKRRRGFLPCRRGSPSIGLAVLSLGQILFSFKRF